jgi:hypothetical protein
VAQPLRVERVEMASEAGVVRAIAPLQSRSTAGRGEDQPEPGVGGDRGVRVALRAACSQRRAKSDRVTARLGAHALSFAANPRSRP